MMTRKQVNAESAKVVAEALGPDLTPPPDLATVLQTLIDHFVWVDTRLASLEARMAAAEAPKPMRLRPRTGSR